MGQGAILAVVQYARRRFGYGASRAVPARRQMTRAPSDPENDCPAWMCITRAPVEYNNKGNATNNIPIKPSRRIMKLWAKIEGRIKSFSLRKLAAEIHVSTKTLYMAKYHAGQKNLGHTTTKKIVWGWGDANL
jgi:hypothetical protein